MSYYYVVRNYPHPRYSGAMFVRFADNPKYKGRVRRIVSVQGSEFSLIESAVKLPTGPDCKLIKDESSLEWFKEKFIGTHDRKDPEGRNVKGIPIDKREVLG